MAILWRRLDEDVGYVSAVSGLITLPPLIHQRRQTEVIIPFYLILIATFFQLFYTLVSFISEDGTQLLPRSLIILRTSPASRRQQYQRGSGVPSAMIYSPSRPISHPSPIPLSLPPLPLQLMAPNTMLEEEEGLLGHTDQTPRRNSKPTTSKFRQTLSFILIAVVSGIAFYLVVFTVVLSRPSLRDSGRKYLFGDDDEVWSSPQESEIAFEEIYTEQSSSSTMGIVTSLAPPSATPTLASEDGLLELSAGELRDMVHGTKGYLARDWSLALGWNNVRIACGMPYRLTPWQMRYIIEAAVLDADLLNRTLVLPSFVYARACEYHMYVCQPLLMDNG